MVLNAVCLVVDKSVYGNSAVAVVLVGLIIVIVSHSVCVGNISVCLGIEVAVVHIIVLSFDAYDLVIKLLVGSVHRLCSVIGIALVIWSGVVVG